MVVPLGLVGRGLALGNRLGVPSAGLSRGVGVVLRLQAERGKGDGGKGECMCGMGEIRMGEEGNDNRGARRDDGRGMGSVGLDGLGDKQGAGSRGSGHVGMADMGGSGEVGWRKHAPVGCLRNGPMGMRGPLYACVGLVGNLAFAGHLVGMEGVVCGVSLGEVGTMDEGNSKVDVWVLGMCVVYGYWMSLWVVDGMWGTCLCHCQW